MKTFIITGASSGLGLSLATFYAQKGNRIFALARGIDPLKDLAGEYPDNLFPISCDITDADQVKAVFTEIEENHGLADVLINNAAVFQAKPFSETDIASIDRIIDTNLKGYLYCTLQVAAGMKARKSGFIINISSVSGTRGIPNEPLYGASKHGVNGFSDVLSQELKSHNVHVVSICPGGIDTPLWNEDNPYPLENRRTKPGEIVELVDFILTRESSTIYKRIIMFPNNEWH